MKQIRLNSPLVPPSLHGTVGCDDRHIPHFWLTRWTQLSLFAHSTSTRETATRALLQLYATAYEVNGTSLDITMTSLDFPKIRMCLNSHLQKLNNDATRRKVNLAKHWAWCITFLEYVLEYLGKLAGSTLGAKLGCSKLRTVISLSMVETSSLRHLDPCHP